MTVITATAILLEQGNQLMGIVNQITMICNQINVVANQENPPADINERIKGLCASLNVQSEAEKSQTFLLQQALDALSDIIK